MKGAALFVALWVGGLQGACTEASGGPIEVRLLPEDRPAGAVRRGRVELDGSRCELEVRDGNGDGVWNTAGTDGLEVRGCQGRAAGGVRRGHLRTATSSYVVEVDPAGTRLRLVREQARLQLIFPVSLHPGVKVVRATARVDGAPDAKAVTLGDAPTPVAGRMPYLVEGELDLALRGHRFQMTFTSRVETGTGGAITPVRLLEELSATRLQDGHHPLSAVAGGKVDVRFRVRGRRGEVYGCIRRDGAPLPFKVTVDGRGATWQVVPRCERGLYQLEWEVPRAASPGETFSVLAETALASRREVQLAFTVTVPGMPASAPTSPRGARPP